MKNTGRFTGLLAAVAASPQSHRPDRQCRLGGRRLPAALTKKGITWPNGGDSTMVNIGHAVCTDWNHGMTFEQTFADAKSGLPQLQDSSIATIMGAATGAYCPQYSQQIRLTRPGGLFAGEPVRAVGLDTGADEVACLVVIPILVAEPDASDDGVGGLARL